MQPFASRAIAPALSTSTLASQSPTASPAPSPSQNATTGIRRASTACQSCKQIKRKCDQARPCSNCRKSNTQCVYNEAEDGRRKAARKRTVESLELKRDALDSILDTFRSSSDAHAQHLLQLIRNGAPLDDIIRYASTREGVLPHRDVQDVLAMINEPPRKNVMSVTALCDTPLFSVPARPWTKVTLDDDFVSHLISIFFTWYYPAYPTLDKSRFLQDMGAGNLSCHFCSPLLVNAMLALACNFSTHPMSCRIPSDGTTRGQHFFDEATRLWSAEEGRPSLVNVQAASFLAVTACLLGKDRLSWTYVESMGQMNQERQLKHARAEKLGLLLPGNEIRESQALTSHAVFLLTVGYGIAFMKPSNDRALFEHAPTPSNSPNLSAWIPYPQQFPEVLFDFSRLRDAFYDLHAIGLHIQTLRFGSVMGDSKLDELDIEQMLTNWKNCLSPSLQMGLESATVIPPILDLHLTYHLFRITLFDFVKRNQTQSLSESCLRDGDQPSSNEVTRATASMERTVVAPAQPDHISTCMPPTQPRMTLSFSRSQSFGSTKAIARLCSHYARDFGLQQPTMWMPQSAASAAYSLIDPATPLHDPEVAEVFHELCSVLTAASRRWLIMKGHVRMLFMTAETRGQQLPPKTKQLLQFVALDQWGDEDHKMFASSMFPNYTLAKDGEDPRINGMGDLLERWASTKITEDTKLGTDKNTVADHEPDSRDSSASV